MEGRTHLEQHPHQQQGVLHAGTKQGIRVRRREDTPCRRKQDFPGLCKCLPVGRRAVQRRYLIQNATVALKEGIIKVSGLRAQGLGFLRGSLFANSGSG
jgi:hypothetical protein